MKSTKIFIVPLTLFSVIGLLSNGCKKETAQCDGPPANCNRTLFDNGNTAACTTLTNTSVFTLSSPSTITVLHLWVNTAVSGQTLTYTLQGPTGVALASGPMVMGSCDPYQTNWCDFSASTNMMLAPGTYTVRSSAMSTCSNAGSNNVGFVSVVGCSAAPTSGTVDAGCAFGGAAYGGGCADAPAANTCNKELFNNGNTAACTIPTDTSTFTLSTTSTVTSIRLWENTTVSGQSVSYQLLNSAGTLLASGPTTKGGCDPYQTNWCEFLVNMNMVLPAGSYTVKSSAKAICANSGSNNLGQVIVKGCVGGTPITTPDAGCVYGGGKYGAACVDAPVAPTCNSTLFDNGNTAACTTLMDASTFTLSAPATVTYIRLWENTTVSGQSVSYQLLNSAGTLLASGPTTKGGCDPYQTNWCEFLVAMNMSLPAGSYTVKSSAKAICANSGSSNLGQVMVKGCAGAASTPDAGVPACNSTLFDNGNTAACTTLMDVSTFTLSAPATVTYIRLWENTTVSGQSVSYQLLNSAGTLLASGPTTKGGCDPYQTNWCEFLVTMNMSLPAGSYTVKSSAKAICANSGSSNLGQVMVKGCAGTSSQPDGGTRLDAGGAAMCVAEGQVCTQLGAGSVPCCSSLYCKSASSSSTTGTCQRSEIAEAGTCGTQTVAGGDEGLTQSFNLGKVPAEFTFRWSTYSIPDRVVVFYGGSILYDSGCSGEDIGNAGSGSKSLLISGATSTITVNVSPNCTGTTTGTAWDFTVDCPK